MPWYPNDDSTLETVLPKFWDIRRKFRSLILCDLKKAKDRFKPTKLCTMWNGFKSALLAKVSLVRKGLASVVVKVFRSFPSKDGLHIVIMKKGLLFVRKVVLFVWDVCMVGNVGFEPTTLCL